MSYTSPGSRRLEVRGQEISFFLIQALGNFLHPYGCQVMVTVRILLKPGQVIKGRCGDFLSPAVDRRDTGISCRLAVLVKFQGIPAVAEIFHMPHLYYLPVLAEADEYGPAVCGNVIFPFPVPSAYRCQYRVCTLPSELFPKPTALQTA